MSDRENIKKAWELLDILRRQREALRDLRAERDQLRNVVHRVEEIVPEHLDALHEALEAADAATGEPS